MGKTIKIQNRFLSARIYPNLESDTAHSFEHGKTFFTETKHFEALPDGGTHVRHAMMMHMPIPRFVRGAALKFVLITLNHYDKLMVRAAQLAIEEFTKFVSPLDGGPYRKAMYDGR